MKKRITAFLLSLLLFPILPLPAVWAAEITPATQADFDVPCKSAILIDEDSGAVLYEKEADAQHPIASITKVMTLLLAFEALESGKVKLTDPVPVSEHSYSMGGSQVWLEPGEQFTLDEMFRAICICSANDAAVAVAELIGGSEPAFVEMMNRRAQELGMTNTHFCNACGLDETGHVSTARDVAIMSREMLLHHTEISNYCTVWMDYLRNGTTQMVNTNKLLKNYTGITGLKTGTTGGAGVCISASASRDGLNLIAVVLGSSSSKERFTAATSLLDYGFANYENAQLQMPQNTPETIAVKHGVQDNVGLYYAAPGCYLMPKGQKDSITAELELQQTVQAPVKQGDQVGTVHILQNGTKLADYPVTVAATVQELTFQYCFSRLAQALLLHPADFVQKK